MTKSERPLTDRVREWMNEQGYPLEMTTAKAFQDAGLDVDQSVYYRDPETDTPREIDVVAGWEDGEFADYFMFSVRFCIECKKSNQPWVVFASPEKHSKSGRRSQYSTNVFRRTWISSMIGQTVQSKLPSELSYKHTFNHWQRSWGTGITTALRVKNESQNDAPYKAMMGATKAAYAIAQQADAKKRKGETEPKQTVLYGALTQPIVVLDGDLFEAVLSESGEIEINQVDESIVLFRYPFARYEEEGIAVRIVTSPKLKDFAKRAMEYQDAVTDCTEAQEKAYKEHLKPKRSLVEMRDAAKAREASRKRTPDIGGR